MTFSRDNKWTYLSNSGMITRICCYTIPWISSHSKAFNIIKEMVSDPLILCKLHFFLFMTSPYQHLLYHFQSYLPLLPFLEDAIVNLMSTLLKKVIRPEVIQSANTNVKLCKIDLDDTTNLKKSSDIDIGTGNLQYLNLGTYL